LIYKEKQMILILSMVRILSI